MKNTKQDVLYEGIWMNKKIDVLNRQPYVDQLIELIDIMSKDGKGGTFTIEGKWGCGKSFVLDMLKEQLGLFQNPEGANDKYIIFHYNCWQYDFYQEPAIAIVAAIRNEIDNYSSILPKLPQEVRAALDTAKDIGKDLLGTIIENKIGCNPLEVIDNYKEHKKGIKQKEKSDNAYDEFFSFKKVLDKTKTEISNLSKEKPLIIFVDELDRCMPEYAIKVLERLHHLFDENDNVIVILAIDREQIERTVENVFLTSKTEKDVVDKYLKKFVKFSVILDNGEISEDFSVKYAAFLDNFIIDEDEKDILKYIFADLFKDVPIREQERVIDKISVVHSLTFKDKSNLFVLYFELLYEITKYRYNVKSLPVDILVRPKQVSMSSNSLGIEDFKKTLIRIQEMSVTNTIRTYGRRDYTVLKDNNLGSAMWLVATLQKNEESYGNYCYPFYKESGDMISNYTSIAEKYIQLSKLIK